MKSFIDRLHSVTPEAFEDIALELFHFQARENRVYADFMRGLAIDSAKILRIEDIPFMPISLFKFHAVKTGVWKAQRSFTSSGTTGESQSIHYIKDESFYHENCRRIFRQFYGNPSEFIILALLPSYLENENSSLISMISLLIRESNHPLSGFYLGNDKALATNLQKFPGKSGRKIILWGVTFALLDLAEKYPMDLENVIIMETGGMKGRREEMIRSEVHRILKEQFNQTVIHSEYGMTELMSQAYSHGGGMYNTPSWMKVYTREINDPLAIDNTLRQGAVNIIDLANFHSCAFIATDDLGRIHKDGFFEILGRLDNSDIRGCNLLLN